MGTAHQAMPAAEDVDLMSRELLRAISAEFLATFLFVYFACATVVGNSVAGDVLANATAFGFSISILIHAVGHISGGHINPAVTLALLVGKRIHWKRGVAYMGSQFLGATLAGFLLWAAMPGTAAGSQTTGLKFGSGCNAFDSDHLGAGSALLVEFMGTFLLVFVVYATVDSTRSSNVLGPVQIGLSVFVAHLAAIPHTGTGINPARTLGPAIAFAALGSSDDWKLAHSGSDGPFEGIWVYFLGPILGALTAAFWYDLWFSPSQNSNLRDTYSNAPAPKDAEKRAGDNAVHPFVSTSQPGVKESGEEATCTE